MAARNDEISRIEGGEGDGKKERERERERSCKQRGQVTSQLLVLPTSSVVVPKVLRGAKRKKKKRQRWKKEKKKYSRGFHTIGASFRGMRSRKRKRKNHFLRTSPSTLSLFILPRARVSLSLSLSLFFFFSVLDPRSTIHDPLVASILVVPDNRLLAAAAPFSILFDLLLAMVIHRRNFFARKGRPL